MAKLNTDKITKGTLVAFNKLPDAVWYEVKSRGRFTLTIVEANTDYAPQVMDVSLVKQMKTG
jgi:hypothetical protein